MKLSKKSRIRTKQVRQNKRRFGAMSDLQIDQVLGKVAAAVKKYWAKRGLSF